MREPVRALRRTIAALAFSVGFSTSAFAQYNWTVSPYLVPNGTEVEAYQVNAGASNFTFTYLKSTTNLILNNSGSVNGTVTFYSYPYDGQLSCMFSKGGIGTLTLNAGLGTQSVTNGITAMTANTEYCFQYVAPAASWYRTQ